MNPLAIINFNDNLRQFSDFRQKIISELESYY
jgi:hypothetical protein